MKKSIGIIGGGNMGEALIKGLVDEKKKLFVPSNILVCETDSQRAKILKEKYGIIIEDLNTVVANSSTVILAVKPQDMESVVSQINDYTKLFISIAAGLTTEFFEKRLGGEARVVRAMPNLPALIGEGVTGFCGGRFTNDSDMRDAGRILGALGGAVRFKESEMDAVTAVSGSGPAYIFFFVEQWINAAVKLGLKEQEARQLVHKTVLGSSEFLRNSLSDVSELRAKVTSKGGTTEAAMKVFFKGNAFGKLMKDALSAAKKRAKELSK